MKHGKTSASSHPAAGPARAAWRASPLSVGVVLALFAATAALVLWRARAGPTPLDARLPERPSLAGQPALFGELVAAAEKQAEATRTRRDGIVQLGRLYHANNFFRAAEACWKLLHVEQPREARWCYYLADLCRSASDYAGMTALLKETLQLAPDQPAALLRLADLQFKTGELAEAQRKYRQRLALLPRDPYAQLGLARLALQKGQNAEALTQLAALVETAPDFSAGHNLYAELLAAAGDATGAARHRWLGRETLRYREADDPWLDELQAWCYDYDRLCVLGTLQLQAGREDQSRKFFERAIAVRPHASRAYELLADLFLKRDDATAARDLLEEALPRLNETQSAAFFSTLSLTYRRLQQPVEAARAARLGLARLGDQPELLDALGLALADSGQHTEALVAWQAALTQNPRDAGMNYHRALSLLALQRLDEALDALELSLTLQPTYLPTLLLRGEIELEAAHLELAEKYLRPAFASHPEDAQARRFLAEWHLRTGAKAEENGDAAGAERNYRAGLIVDDNHAGLLLRLGAFYLVHQRPAEAIAPLSRHHNLLPENAPGCLFLGQAYAITGERNKAREILSAGIKLADQAGDPTTATHCRRIMKQL